MKIESLWHWGLLLAVALIVSWRLLQRQHARVAEWRDRPAALWDADLICVESQFRSKSRWPIVARVDRAYRLPSGLVVLVELKTRSTAAVRASDVIQLSAQRVAVEDELRVQVSDEAFVIFPGRHSAPPTSRAVRLMSREQIEAVAARHRRLIDGLDRPQWPDSEHVCHGCGHRAACGARVFIPSETGRSVSTSHPTKVDFFMMDFDLGEEHRLLEQSIREWGARAVTPRIQELDRAHQFDKGLLPQMAELGLLGVSVPADYGGAGMDYLALGVASEELEYLDTSLRVILSVHVGLNSLSLLAWGNEDQKARYLVPQAQGQKIATFGLTEPAAGSDARQNAQLVQAVMTTVRFPAPGATDAALDAECKARDVEQSYYRFQGSFSVPLANRPPFDRLTR